MLIKCCQSLLTFTTMLGVNAAAYAIETPVTLRQILVSNQKNSQSNRQDNLIAQVTSASHSLDVQPKGWAFQALQSLVKHYGCPGYPNPKFPGNRAITRDEFAHALNACLNRVNELNATTDDSDDDLDTIKKADLVNIQKLQQAFKVELAKLRGYNVRANTPSLPENQSSGVTKPTTGNSPQPSPKPEETEKVAEIWNAHFQSTIIWQSKNAMSALYTGANSLVKSPQQGFTFNATAYLGTHLWKGGEFYLNPEVSSTVNINNGALTGLGGLSNGENQKQGSAIPEFYIARAFLRQTWDLGGTKEFVDSETNQLAEKVSNKRLVLSVGKMSVVDLFYSHDSRTQFFNWSFITHGSFDFSADARGYSIGAALEYYDRDWAFRMARFAQPTESNGAQLDFNLWDHYGDQVEIEHDHVIGGQAGKVRILAFRNQTVMGGFQDALNLWRANGSLGVPSVADVRRLQTKVGFGVSLEQKLGNDVEMFIQGNWADGGTETFDFTEIERQLAGGLMIQGDFWGCAKDMLGLGYSINGLGSAHIDYLENGGLGAFIGDGQLNYQPEQVLEALYNLNVNPTTTLGFDAQYIFNPAYNADRGPVTFFGLRIHTEF